LRPVERPKAEALGYLEAEVAAAEAAGVMSADEGATRLVLFAEDGGVALSVGVKTIGFAALPGGTVFGVGDVPVGVALFGHGAEVLTEVFEGGASPEPIAVVDFEDDEAWFQHDGVGDHRVVCEVGVFGDVEIFLDAAAGVGEEGPVGADSGSIFVGFGDVVGADGDQTSTMGCCPCSSESFRRVVV
jgi:hypothetical protein